MKRFTKILFIMVSSQICVCLAQGQQNDLFRYELGGCDLSEATRTLTPIIAAVGAFNCLIGVTITAASGGAAAGFGFVLIIVGASLIGCSYSQARNVD